MKKLIYCACVAALATACTNEELVSENTGAAVSRGITFETTIEGAGTDSRGELTEDYRFFWYAEQDRINVYADNVKAAGTNATNGIVTDWFNLSAPAVYKATKSASQGQFTAQDDDNWLAFKNNQYSYFVALYPQTTTLAAVSSKSTVNDGNNNPLYTDNVVFSIDVAKPNMVQQVALNQVDAPMYSKNYGKRSASYESVGEKMALSFKRPFPVLRFTSADNTADVNAVIGKLNSVSITTMGAAIDSEGYALAPTNIAATSASYSLKDLKTVGGYVNCNVPTLNGGVATATTDLVTASTWGAGDNVYMSIYPVKREGTKSGSTVKKQMTEKFNVTYNYEKVTLTKELSTAANWNIENAVYEIQTLDIANDYPWIVTNADANGKRALVVFKGNFSDIYKAGTTPAQSQIVWKSATGGVVAPADITEIISYVALTDAELQSLKTKYTSLTKLTLNANTSIPANVFNATLAGQITDLKMPLVTEMGATNFVAFSTLKNLNLKSYAFAEDNIYAKFFNSDVQATLETLNIEAVTSLRPTFGYDRTIVFTDYANLKSVALNANGVALTASAFKGCENLETVTGKVDIANAPDAFNGASTAVAANKRPTINVINAIIPNGAFRNARIKDIKLGNAQVVPTEIGEYAFEGNTAIVLMDLSQATIIGKNAFNNASAFVGTASANRNVINVVAATINENIFAGTSVVRVQFSNATKIGRNLFNNCSALKQVKFLSKVTTKVNYGTSSAPVYGQAFAGVTTENLDLFVATSQSDVNGLVWNFTGNTFKSITKEDIAWGE